MTRWTPPRSRAASSRASRPQYAFKPGTVVLTDDAVEPELEKDLAAGGLPGTTVDCPDTIKVKEGEMVTCTATGPGGRQSQLPFTFSNDDGTIDESSVSG